LLHGLMEIALERFSQRGYDITVVPFDMKDMTDVEMYAEHIADVVRRIANARSEPLVSVVGFSKGSIASYSAIKRHGIASTVDTFVAVAGPFRGSQLSRLAKPTALLAPLRHIGLPLDVSRIADQLSIGSEYLTQLRAEPLPSGPRLVTIAGKYDFICPKATALLEDSEQVVLEFSHHDIVHSETLHETAFSYCK
jgi:hypothetical protein